MPQEFYDWLNQCPVLWLRHTENREEYTDIRFYSPDVIDQEEDYPDENSNQFFIRCMVCLGLAQ